MPTKKLNHFKQLMEVKVADLIQCVTTAIEQYAIKESLLKEVKTETEEVKNSTI